MRVLVTRPAGQADTWVRALAARGVDAVALPLIDIAAPHDPAPVQAAWRALGDSRLAVFVSPNAARAFFQARPQGAAWPASTRAASVGPGTTQALRALGVPPSSIVEPHEDSAQFDSEALWQRLERDDWRGAHVLVVRGDGGRDWLADTLRGAGAEVAFVAAYRRAAPRFDGECGARLAYALAHPESHVWLFSSSEAIDHLMHAPQPAAGADWSRARAIATHPRIASRARERGFGAVLECRPTVDAVVACIQSRAS
ncbi:MAG TPA: uroporphyrinogen-III synthase [Burkholderiales bacterium]|nr:uroporphyrinogen-III synthase [Burkholderiales bacterium]